MKRKIISVLLIIIIVMSMTSCKFIQNGKVKNDNATIQLWVYDYDHENFPSYKLAIENVLTKIKIYCNGKDIPLEVVRYGQDTINYEDYVLKRNVSMASGNVITIDDARSISDIAKYHADYSRVENYNKLQDVYKDKFCIPLGVEYMNFVIFNEILNYYNISVDKPIISYEDYFEIKQELKNKGARFKLNIGEWREMLEYYLIKNGLKYLDEKKLSKNMEKELKKDIKKTVKEVYDDFKLYNQDYDGIELLIDSNKEITNKDFLISDVNSNLELSADNIGVPLSSYFNYERMNEDILSYIFVIDNDRIFKSPCVYMHKEITNNKIYDVFNELISDSYFVSLSEGLKNFTTVHNTEKVRKYLELDDNWKYNGPLKDTKLEKYKRINEIIDESYRKLVKDKEESETMVNYYFEEFGSARRIIHNYVDGMVIYLIKDKLDYNDKEVDSFINQEIDECIKSIKVYMN